MEYTQDQRRSKIEWTTDLDKLLKEYSMTKKNMSDWGRMHDSDELKTLIPGATSKDINDRIYRLRKRRQIPKTGDNYHARCKEILEGKGDRSATRSKRKYIKSGKYSTFNITIPRKEKPVHNFTNVPRGTFEAIIIGSSIIAGSFLLGVALILGFAR